MKVESPSHSQSANLIEDVSEEALDQIDTTPQTEISSLLSRVSTGLNIAVKVMLILTFIVGYFEYRATLRERELNAAFELITNWEDGGFQTAYEAIGSEIDQLRTKFREQMPDKQPDTVVERAFINNQVLSLAGSNRSFTKDINQVFYFYGKLGICVEQNICNKNMVYSFFHDSAEDFFYYFQPYADTVRADGQPEFAQFAENFVKNKP